MRVCGLVLVGLFLVPLAVPAADVIPEDKAVITFDTRLGVVTFNHSLHATVRGIECGSCHHTHTAGQPIKPCSDCHLEKDAVVPGMSVVAPKNKTAYHDKCKGCHQYTLAELEKPSGPTRCRLCHVREN